MSFWAWLLPSSYAVFSFDITSSKKYYKLSFHVQVYWIINQLEWPNKNKGKLGRRHLGNTHECRTSQIEARTGCGWDCCTGTSLALLRSSMRPSLATWVMMSHHHLSSFETGNLGGANPLMWDCLWSGITVEMCDDGRWSLAKLIGRGLQS
jgi:hypothetical protein